MQDNREKREGDDKAEWTDKNSPDGIHRECEPVTIELIKGEVQPPEFRDWPFAVLFFVQLAGVAGTAIVFGPALISARSGEDDEDTSQFDDGNGTDKKIAFSDIMFFLVAVFTAAALMTMSFFRLMIHNPLKMIQISFFIAPITFVVVGLTLLGASAPTEENQNGDVHDTIVSYWFIIAAAFSLMSICFYTCFKRFMPFAAVNLKVALTAVRSNIGLFFLSMGSLFVVYAWAFLWLIAVGGVFYHDSQKPQVSCPDYSGSDYNYNQGAKRMCDQEPSTAAIVMLLLCFYWTQQVIQNTIHTTTAGAVSSWWIIPEEGEQYRRGCLGQDVSSALYRSCTYSFGSICFGSLLVAILQTLEQIARSRRNRRDIVSCVIQCIVICLRNYLEYFNSWAFCYVGIYGYDYLTAGRKVIDLFKARGWTTFITDRLIFRVLMFVHLGIAALTGAISCLVMAFLGRNYISGEDDTSAAMAFAFWIGFFVGLIVSSTVLFVIESSVRTIMVCFAEQPGEGGGRSLMFQELRETYVSTYPSLFQGSSDSGTEMNGNNERNVV